MYPDNEQPVAGGTARFYEFGTSNPATVYSDRHPKTATEIQQPVPLDHNGTCAGFFKKAVWISVYDSNGQHVKNVPYVGLLGEESPQPRSYGFGSMVVDEESDVKPVATKVGGRRCYAMADGSGVVVEGCTLSSGFDNHLRLCGYTKRIFPQSKG